MDQETRTYLDSLLDTKLKAMEDRLASRMSTLETKCDTIGKKVDAIADRLLAPPERKVLASGAGSGHGQPIPMAAKPHK